MKAMAPSFTAVKPVRMALASAMLAAEKAAMHTGGVMVESTA